MRKIFFIFTTTTHLGVIQGKHMKSCKSCHSLMCKFFQVLSTSSRDIKKNVWYIHQSEDKY